MSYPPSLDWSPDPVGLYRALHPVPVLVTVCAKTTKGGHECLGSLTDPSIVAGNPDLTDPRYCAVWWTVCGQRGKVPLRPHATRAGWCALRRQRHETGERDEPVQTLAAIWADLDQKGPHAAYRQDGRTDYPRFLPAMWRISTDAGGVVRFATSVPEVARCLGGQAVADQSRRVPPAPVRCRGGVDVDHRTNPPC